MHHCKIRFPNYINPSMAKFAKFVTLQARVNKLVLGKLNLQSMNASVQYMSPSGTWLFRGHLCNSKWDLKKVAVVGRLSLDQVRLEITNFFWVGLSLKNDEMSCFGDNNEVDAKKLRTEIWRCYVVEEKKRIIIFCTCIKWTEKNALQQKTNKSDKLF